MCCFFFASVAVRGHDHLHSPAPPGIRVEYSPKGILQPGRQLLEVDIAAPGRLLEEPGGIRERKVGHCGIEQRESDDVLFVWCSGLQPLGFDDRDSIF